MKRYEQTTIIGLALMFIAFPIVYLDDFLWLPVACSGLGLIIGSAMTKWDGKIFSSPQKQNVESVSQKQEKES